jgi:hypothetical protein
MISTYWAGTERTSTEESRVTCLESILGRDDGVVHRITESILRRPDPGSPPYLNSKSSYQLALL